MESAQSHQWQPACRRTFPYVLRRRLGRGGFGEVFKARALALSFSRAAKRNTSLAAGVHEAQMMAGLHHQNLGGDNVNVFVEQVPRHAQRLLFPLMKKLE